jgi:hypothetical protein
MELQASATSPLAPGTYTRADFTPRVTFDIGPDQAGLWFGTQLLDGFFDIQHDVGSPDVIAVQFARPSAVFGANGSPVPLARAADAMAVLKANATVSVIAAGAVTIGGHSAPEVTVEYRSGTANLLLVPPGPVSILAGRRLQMAFLDTPDGVVAILVGGSVATWQAALDAAQPVLESIRISG